MIPIQNDLCSVCGKDAICGGLGVVSFDVPVDDPRFGKLFRCPNNPVETDNAHQARMRRISNLDAFTDKRLNNFIFNRPMLSYAENLTLEAAFEAASRFVESPVGWLILQGPYGCGKTHLAAAIGNARLAKGDMVLFITVPDLLDHLRSTYGPSSEIGYDETFDRIRNAQLLILDDLGAENPSQWAGEKLFQLLNHRYSNHLPTVITSNADLDRIDGRIRSRMLDTEIVSLVIISAPDYRTSAESQQNELTKFSHYSKMRFDNFDTRTGVSYDEHLKLEELLSRVKRYADKPEKWLVLIGPYGCGKTHLAAAIANHQMEQRVDVIFATTPDLMDYLRVTFSPNAATSFQQRFQHVLDIPLLILDDLNPSQSTAWVKEKLFQIIEYRFIAQLPTVITTAKQVEELDERIRSRLTHEKYCDILAIRAIAFADRLKNAKR